MARVCKGIAIRLLYMLAIGLMTALVVIMYEGRLKMSGFWFIGLGAVGLLVEGVVTNKLTQGFDWKWFNIANIIFAANGLAAIWFLQLRFLSYNIQGVFICTNTTGEQELRSLDVAVLSDWLDFCGCGHCNGAAEQLFVIMLLIGRYFLPRGVHFYNKDDKINTFLKSLTRTHYLLVIACNGADVLDIMSYSRYPGVKGNSYIVGILLILFTISMVQFCIDTLATVETKASDIHIIVETDLWSSLILLLTDDIPFIFMRIFLLVNYQAFSTFGTFFLFKNILCLCITLHKAAIIWRGKDEDEIEDYVVAIPRDRSDSLSSADDLSDISDDDSLYSHPQAVGSRVERRISTPGESWGEQSQWFSKTDMKDASREDTMITIDEVNEEDERNNQLPATSVGDVKYFTDDYADEIEANRKTKKVGAQRTINIPLGIARIKGRIDFSGALPRPVIKIVRSSSRDREKRSKKEEELDIESIEKKRAKDPIKVEDGDKEEDKTDETIDEIIDIVDEQEAPKEKKKKRKRDKSKGRRKEGSERSKKDGRGEKKHKKRKKRSKSDDRNEEDREKRKKKKRSKDKEQRNKYSEDDLL